VNRYESWKELKFKCGGALDVTVGEGHGSKVLEALRLTATSAARGVHNRTLQGEVLKKSWDLKDWYALVDAVYLVQSDILPSTFNVARRSNVMLRLSFGTFVQVTLSHRLAKKPQLP